MYAEPGCGAILSVEKSASALDKHYSRKHRVTYATIKATQQPTGPLLVQTTPLPRPLSPARQQQLLSASLNWVVSQQLPFSIFDSKEFKQFAFAISPYVAPPCSATIRNNLQNHRHILSDKLRAILDRTLLYGAITADGWSSTGTLESRCTGSMTHFAITNVHWQWSRKNIPTPQKQLPS